MVAAIPQAAPSTASANPHKTHQDSQTHLQNPTRPPLLPSEKHNDPLQRRPRAKQVPSRYLSPSPSTSTSTSTTTTTTTTNSSSSSRRFPSPLLSRSTNLAPSSTPLQKRAQSVDRGRPSTARPVTPGPPSNAGEVSAASRMLITSTRSLSVSFQGEAFSLPISKAKSAATPASVRKITPERRRTVTPVRGGGDQVDNSRGMDQHRWPGRARQLNVGPNPLTRSLDFRVEKKVTGSGSGAVIQALQQSMIDERRLSLDLGSAELLKPVHQNLDSNSVNETCIMADLSASDTDSMSSGSTSGLQECGSGIGKTKSGPRGIVVSARFWQDTNSRLRRLQDPGSPLSTSPVSRMAAPNKVTQSKRLSSDSQLSSPRTMGSPARGAARPASPSKLWTSATLSPSRGNASPSRVRNGGVGVTSGNSSNTPSILSFSVDIRRGKVGKNRVIDAHLLRLLYNRHLQWRFVNARADATFMVQRLNAEKNLWTAWLTISELRHSVTLRRIKFLLLRQKLKLTSILKGQMTYLEEWALLDRDHSNSLLGATEALKASTLRLPVVGKANADIQNLKDAIGSAVDVMQAMASSICSLSLKVEEVNSLVTELANVTAKEKALLEQCKDFLSTLAAMQVKDCSLRTHILQLNRLPITGSLTTFV